jgi:hypothetical protein
MKRLLPFFLGATFCLAAGCSSETREGPGGWYCAGSNLKDDKAPGGFGPCDNFPKKREKDGPGKPGELSLVAFPDEVVDFRNRKAVVIRLINRSEQTKAFSACDSSLYIVQEALDRQGQWKPLERFPDTSCGNSFHRVFLESNEYWEFFAIVRSGQLKTKLRFRLEAGREEGNAVGGGALYSNEYEGSIDPSECVRATNHQ